MLLTYALSGRHQNKLYQASLPFFSPKPLLRLPIFFFLPLHVFFSQSSLSNIPSCVSQTSEISVSCYVICASDRRRDWHKTFWPIKILSDGSRLSLLIGRQSGTWYFDWPMKIARNVEVPFSSDWTRFWPISKAVLQNTKNFLKKKKLLYCLLLICRGWNWKEDNSFYRWCPAENRKRNKRIKWKT